MNLKISKKNKVDEIDLNSPSLSPVLSRGQREASTEFQNKLQKLNDLPIIMQREINSIVQRA